MSVSDGVFDEAGAEVDENQRPRIGKFWSFGLYCPIVANRTAPRRVVLYMRGRIFDLRRSGRNLFDAAYLEGVVWQNTRGRTLT